jgi:hypothetical protein
MARCPSGCGTAEAPGRRLLLDAVQVVVVLGRRPAPAAAGGQRLAPLLLVGHVVLAELLRRGLVHQSEAHAEQPQPLRDGVDRGGRDDEQTEDGEQHQQRHREHVGHGGRQRGGRGPADEAACVPYGLHAPAAGGRAAADVDLSEHADDEGGQTDDDPAVGLGLLGVPDEAHGDHRDQDRHQQVEPAEGAGDQDLDEVADRAPQVGPGTRGDDQRDAEQQQREAVLAVRGVEVPGAVPYAAEDRADGVREAEPKGAHEPVEAPGRTRCRPGRGLPRRGLPGGSPLRGDLLGSGLPRRSLRGSGRLLRGRLLGCGGT